MSVLVDTSIWSLAFRRHRRDLNSEEIKLLYEWESLVVQGEASIIGPIRQETLSGISTERQFEFVLDRLAGFIDLPLPSKTYALAAKFYNICRAAGTAAGHVDMIICAAAETHGIAIFSIDPDFPLYARHLPIKLHRPK